MKRILHLPLIGLLLLACTVIARPIVAQSKSDGSISVNGEATVRATPDRALVVMAVSTTEPTTVLTKASNDSIVARVLATAHGLGISENDIQTDLVSLQPHYVYNNSASKLEGYTMSKTVTMRVLDLKNFDDVLSKMLASGVTTINSIELQSSQTKKLQRQAEEEAVQDAKDHAAQLAKEFGVKLGAPIRISQTQSTVRPLHLNTNNMQADVVCDAVGSQPATALGQLTIKTSVSVQYSIQ